MEIKHCSDYCLVLKGKKENLIINPVTDGGEVKTPKVESRVVVLADKEELGGAELRSLGEKYVVVNGPGEYEVGGVEIVGLNGGEGNTIYLITIDGVVVCYLGKYKEELSDKKIEKLQSTDVLIVSDQLGGKKALEIAGKIGANFVIPTGYSDDESRLKEFLDGADREGLEAIDSLKINIKDELPEGVEVVVLRA
jgi:hypothetical protein